MSVCTFSLEELANVAAVIAANDTWGREGSVLTDACEALAKVATANVACFNDRYSHAKVNAVAYTAEDIKRAALRFDMAPGAAKALGEAWSTAHLFHYNCDDAGGDFTLKVEGAHAALIWLLEKLCDAMARKAGVTS